MTPNCKIHYTQCTFPYLPACTFNQFPMTTRLRLPRCTGIFGVPIRDVSVQWLFNIGLFILLVNFVKQIINLINNSFNKKSILNKYLINA
jgi:hypothetical protein